MANAAAQARADDIWMLAAKRIWAALTLAWESTLAVRFRGGLCAVFGASAIAAFATYNPADPSWNAAGAEGATNLMGGFGAVLADIGLQSLGIAAWIAALLMVALGVSRAGAKDPRGSRLRLRRGA